MKTFASVSLPPIIQDVSTAEFVELNYEPTVNIPYDSNVENYRVKNVAGDCAINILNVFPGQEGTLEIEMFGDSVNYTIALNGTLIGTLPAGINLAYLIRFKSINGNLIYTI